MAKVTVSGDVEAVKETKTGKIIVQIGEVYPSQTGEQWVRKWSLWMPSSFMVSDMAAGDWVEVEGTLSTKVVEWQNASGVTKQIIDHNLNEVRVVQHKAQAQTAAPVDEDDRRKYGSGMAPF